MRHARRPVEAFDHGVGVVAAILLVWVAVTVWIVVLWWSATGGGWT